MKSISTIITENTVVKAHALVIDIRVGVSPKHGVSLRFILLPALQMFG